MKNIVNIIFSGKRLPFTLFILAVILFSANIGGLSIYMLDEAKNTECAREMLEQKDYIVPTFNYELRTDKPPLHYYFMILSYKIFGVNEFAARLFSALFGALTVLMTFLYTRRFLGEKPGLWSAIVLLASIHMALEFHMAVPDPYLVFFFCWTLFLFYAAYKEKKTRDVYLFYLAAGLGVLTKGPVVIAIPGMSILIFLFLQKKLSWGTIKLFRPWFGIILLLAVCLPWYLQVGLDTNWEWTKGFFLKHNLGRFTDKMEGHGGFFLITLGYILLGLFPFSTFIFQSLSKGWKERKNDYLLFNGIAALSILLFFTISKTKLPNYTVPAYPFFAVLIGTYLISLYNKEVNVKSKSVKASYISLLVFSFLIPIGAYIAFSLDKSLFPVRDVALWLLVLPAGITVAFIEFRKSNIKQSVIVTAATTMLTSLIIYWVAMPVVDRQNPVTQSITKIKNAQEIVFWEKYNPAFSFYLKRHLPELQDSVDFRNFVQNNPDGIILTTTQKITDINSGLVLKTNTISKGKDLFETPITLVLKVKGNSQSQQND